MTTPSGTDTQSMFIASTNSPEQIPEVRAMLQDLGFSVWNIDLGEDLMGFGDLRNASTSKTLQAAIEDPTNGLARITDFEGIKESLANLVESFHPEPAGTDVSSRVIS